MQHLNKEIPTYNFIQTTGKDYLVKLFSWDSIEQYYDFHEPHGYTFYEILLLHFARLQWLSIIFR